jgi:SAM-dependent methyltransferase
MTTVAATNSTPVEPEWHWQWSHMSGPEHQSERLFWEWVHPLTPEDFRGRTVLDAGCGAGHMLGYLRPVIAQGVGIDLNTSSVAARRFEDVPHIEIHAGDAATWSEQRGFDVVLSIGVVHHTADPAATVRNLMRLVRPGGRLVLWVYGHEGNLLARWLVEGPKRLYRGLPRPALWAASLVLTALITPIVHTLYRLPLRMLPFHAYFANWRRLSFVRNATNVFDKLNAPTTHFIKRGEIDDWFRGTPFENIRVSSWCDLSWRVCATLSTATETNAERPLCDRVAA